LDEEDAPDALILKDIVLEVNEEGMRDSLSPILYENRSTNNEPKDIKVIKENSQIKTNLSNPE
jgi:hypothetical protein